MLLSDIKSLLRIKIRAFKYWWRPRWKRLAPWFAPLFFLIHWYPIALFEPSDLREGFRVLVKYTSGTWIISDRKGNLRLIRSKSKIFGYKLLNMLSLGALEARLQVALYCTFMAMTLEYLNPFTKEILRNFIERKYLFLSRLSERLPFNAHGIRRAKRNLHCYLKGSHLQLHIIDKVHLAVHRQGHPPVVEEARRALEKGALPRLSLSGAGGTYFMSDTQGNRIGIFKPFDEELKAPNNPVRSETQGALGVRGARIGARVGESCHHEVATFLIDQFLGFGIVPKTYYACFKHTIFHEVRADETRCMQKVKTKYGSFQEYIDGFVPFISSTPEQLAAVPLHEIQFVIILDALIGNMDRNVENILIGDGELVAIDHGLAFPDMVTDELSTWFWEVYPWCYKYFIGPLVDLIRNFPFEKLSWKLQKQCLLEADQISRMRERFALFRAGVLAGLVPLHLAHLMRYENLLKLVDYTETLEKEAKELVENYLYFLKKWPWARLRF